MMGKTSTERHDVSKMCFCSHILIETNARAHARSLVVVCAKFTECTGKSGMESHKIRLKDLLSFC